MSVRTFMIVGASLAGAKAAEELRERGFDGRVVVLGAEAERPYERPPLTKDYLRGESPREKAYVHEDGFYAARAIELETATTVAAIDPAAARVRLADGRELPFDRLLLATGAEARQIRVPGAYLGGVHYLRTLADCDILRDRLQSGGHVVVVGAGWIGSEFAASARQRGLGVTIVDPASLPNERIFGAEIGTFYRDVHAQHGIELVLGEAVEAFEGDGSIARVRTSAGRKIECDFAVVGIGVTPRVALAQQAGLGVDNGIVVDEKLQTSAPNVFAAGDVARGWHPFYAERMRVEHWANALHRARPRHRRCSASPSAMTAFPTSTPTSTTSAWSIPATHRNGTRSSSAVTGTLERSLPFGSRMNGSSPG
jgi:3-phenylpropionate/trans-cinnamate dioxygenase ferredoxin reductase component